MSLITMVSPCFRSVSMIHLPFILVIKLFPPPPSTNSGSQFIPQKASSSRPSNIFRKGRDLPVVRKLNWMNSKEARHYIHKQGDSFGTRPKKMRISQRLFIRFWTGIYDCTPCFMKSMSILEEMLEMFATTVQADLNATLHVCESGLQDVLTNRSNFTSNVVFQFLYGAWLVGISFYF